MVYTCITEQEYNETIKDYDVSFTDENGKTYYWKGQGSPDLKNVKTKESAKNPSK